MSIDGAPTPASGNLLLTTSTILPSRFFPLQVLSLENGMDLDPCFSATGATVNLQLDVFDPNATFEVRSDLSIDLAFLLLTIRACVVFQELCQCTGYPIEPLELTLDMNAEFREFPW